MWLAPWLLFSPLVKTTKADLSPIFTWEKSIKKESISRIGVTENPVLGELLSQLALTIISEPEADDNPAKADLRFLINVMIFLPSTTTCRGMERYCSLTEYA
jgi:hypothetical protein